MLDDALGTVTMQRPEAIENPDELILEIGDIPL